MTKTERSTKTATAATSNTASALWRIAVSEYQTADAAYQALSARDDEQATAYHAELGERPTDLDKYFEGRFPEYFSGDVALHVASAIAAKDYRGRTISAEDYEAITEKARSIVEQAHEYRRRSDEIYDRTIGTVHPAWEASLDAVCEKRAALLTTPAPDAAAMLYKLNVLVPEMTAALADDAEAITAIRDDAARLFGDK